MKTRHKPGYRLLVFSSNYNYGTIATHFTRLENWITRLDAGRPWLCSSGRSQTSAVQYEAIPEITTFHPERKRGGGG
jgi:hypothetical protein